MWKKVVKITEGITEFLGYDVKLIFNVKDNIKNISKENI